MTNKKLGNDFEKELCELLSKQGFWCHNFAQNQDGQPAYIIAVKNKRAYLIDCKVCSTRKGFDLSRMEENQDLSMELWRDCYNGEGWFALKLENRIYMIPHITVKAYCNEQSAMLPKDIFECGKPLDKWIKSCR